MSVISVASLNLVLDHRMREYARALGTSGSGYGVGDDAASFGASASDSAALAAVLASADDDVIGDLRQSFSQTNSARGISDYIYWKSKRCKDALDRHIKNRGGLGADSANLHAYLKYLNYGTATKWQAQQDGRIFRPWYYAMTDASRDGTGGSYPEARTCYFEVLQGTLDAANHLYTLGMGRFVATGAGAGNFTAATLEGDLITNGSGFGMIDTSKWAPAIPHIVVSGITGSGVVTVTGKGYKPNGTTESAVTWTATATGNGTFALAVGSAAADSRIYEVTNIGIAAGISAGTIYVLAMRNTTPATTRLLCL